MIRMTEEKDIPHVMEIIHMAQEQFCRMGIDQWQDGYPNEEVIRRDMDRRESYVAEKEETVIGTAAISMEKEENYEIIKNGEWLTGNRKNYAVIHRIATHNAYKRNGTADAFLRFAQQAALKKGKENIRIDTHPDNRIMQNWIRKNGFVYCGHIFLDDGALRYAYEKCL